MAKFNQDTGEWEADEGRCQEAGPLSSEKYFPCNRPAVSIVEFTARKEGPYRMCEMCADHNIRNRGATLVGPFIPEHASAKTSE